MTESYATAKAAYRELRSTIGPWAKANSYRRWAGSQAGWQKPVDAEQRLLFKFEGDAFGNPDTGNSYHGLVQLEPLGSQGSTILRQVQFLVLPRPGRARRASCGVSTEHPERRLG